MKIKRKYTPIYKNATALLRPKTGLNDMLIELTPGSQERRRAAEETSTIPVDQTLPNINADEILAGARRRHARLPAAADRRRGRGPEGQRGQPRRRRSSASSPTGRDILEDHEAARRAPHDNIRRSIHNFSLLSQALGAQGRASSRELVESSNAVFRAFANQDAKLREALSLLPGTLRDDQHGAEQGQPPRPRRSGPTLRRAAARRPRARPVAGRRRGRSCARRRRSSSDQLRPFARDAQPTVKLLRPAAANLAEATPELTTSLEVVN